MDREAIVGRSASRARRDGAAAAGGASATRGEARSLLSVGIDVGTTTTQVVFSTLHVRTVTRGGLLPGIEIDRRSLQHVGPARFTPVLAPDGIDVDALLVLVRREYAAAGVDPADVETGAVIITGETARRKNADAVLETLSGLAGDFVVTVAGPALEAQIAARGSGAAAYSAERYSTVCNVDIGGGSANAALFRSGRHVASAAIMVGGRGVELDPSTGTVRALTASARAVIERLGLRLDVGRRAEVGMLRAYGDAVADLVVDLVTGTASPLFERVRLSAPLPRDPLPSAVLLSGGVGRCYYEQTPAASLGEIAAYGDVGPLIAAALRRNHRLRSLTVVPPARTLSATVIGAASQTVTLSGTTIWAPPELLPVRNLPVVEPDAVLSAPERLADAVRSAAHRRDPEAEGRVAIALDLPPRLDYPGLSAVARGLADYAAGALAGGVPLVVVTERDYAQALGQTVQGLRPELPLIAIDQVRLDEGDFIDIGRPLLGGRAAPVSVKTLVFDE